MAWQNLRNSRINKTYNLSPTKNGFVVLATLAMTPFFTNGMDEFAIKVGEFEGPLDLLLGLIEKKKLHISEVSLSQVTDDYIAYLKQFEDTPLSNMANFILVASTLILIKSYSLISSLAVTEEEKADIEDLEKRLKLYGRIKELSVYVKALFGQSAIFVRENTSHFEPVFTPTEEITQENILKAIKSVIDNLPKKETPAEAIIKKVISLEEVINDLSQRIQQSFKVKFSDYTKLANYNKEKVNIIISFLGMLELVKQGIIEVKQDSMFADIDMESKNVAVPRY